MIHFRKLRLSEKSATTTDAEKTELRGCLGAISYKAQQSGPMECAETGLLLSNVNHSTVTDLEQTNKLLDRVRTESHQKIIVHSFPGASELIPVGSLNSEQHSTYLQKCHRTRRSDSQHLLKWL